MRRSDRGTTLLLLPAAVVIVLALGVIAVDQAAVSLGRRTLADAAATAAQDALAASINPTQFAQQGELTIDSERLDAALLVSLQAQQTALVNCALDPGCGSNSRDYADSPPTLTVTLCAPVEPVFGGAYGRSAAMTCATGSATLTLTG